MYDGTEHLLGIEWFGTPAMAILAGRVRIRVTQVSVKVLKTDRFLGFVK